MAIKDWAGPAIAFLALGVSGTTAYFNIIRQNDDLRLVVNDGPYLIMKGKTGELTFYPDYKLTFVNSGTRGVAIANVRMEVRQPGPGIEEPTQCDGASEFDHTFEYDLAPFVVKPSEVLAVPVTKIKEPESPLIYLSPLNIARKRSYYTFWCLRIRIITPDSADKEVAIPLSVDRSNKGGGGPGGGGGGGDGYEFNDRHKPIVLLQTSGFDSVRRMFYRD